MPVPITNNIKVAITGVVSLSTDVTLGAALAGYQTFAGAGVPDGTVVSYAIEDGRAFECGTGPWHSATNTLSRSVVSISSLGGGMITPSANATLWASTQSDSFDRYFTQPSPPASTSGTLQQFGAQGLYTLAVFAATNIPANVAAVMILGLNAAGDCPHFVMRKVGAQPGHAAKVQTLDGAWWQLQSDCLYPQQIVLTGQADDSANLILADAAAAALSISLRINRQYLLGASINFTANVVFENGGKLKPTGAYLYDFLNGFQAPMHYPIFDFSASGSGLKRRAIAKILTRELYPQMFSAVGDYSTANSAYFDRFFAACMAAELPGYIPQGRYLMDAPTTIDLDPIKYTGLVIKGAGKQKSILDWRTATISDAAFAIECTANVPRDNSYLKLEDFGICSSHDGPTHRLGRYDFSDPVNMPEYRSIWIQNYNNTTNVQAMVMNYVLGGQFHLQANCSTINGNGDALRINQGQFNDIFGSFGTSARAIHLTASGIIASNKFHDLDMENCGICAQVDAANAIENTFDGGTWNYYSYGYYDAAGSYNIINNPQPNPSPPATLASFMTGRGTGVKIVSSNPSIFPVGTPAFPGWGTSMTNNTARRIEVEFWWAGATTPTSYTRNGFSITLSATSNNKVIAVEPGDTFSLNGSGTNPSMLWRGAS